MSVPSSPQNEAIQHSSISTSNGVSSSTAALASGPALGPAADHSTEEEDASHAQSSGSWSGLWLVAFIPGSHVEMRGTRDSWRTLVSSPLCFYLSSFQSSTFLQRVVSTVVGEGTWKVMQTLYWLSYLFHLWWFIYWGSRRNGSRQSKCVRIHSERKQTYRSTIKGLKRWKDWSLYNLFAFYIMHMKGVKCVFF